MQNKKATVPNDLPNAAADVANMFCSATFAIAVDMPPPIFLSCKKDDMVSAF